MRFRNASWVLAVFVLFIVGCEGSEGPRGPAGPAGTANVIYSDWFSPATWESENFFGTAERTYTMTAPGLTQEIIDSGVVMVYMRFMGVYPAIMQLPLVLDDQSYSFSFRAQAGSIKVVYYDMNAPATDPGAIPSSNQVRYVLVPGGVIDETAASMGTTAGKLVDSLEGMSYGEACGLFGITE